MTQRISDPEMPAYPYKLFNLLSHQRPIPYLNYMMSENIKN